MVWFLMVREVEVTENVLKIQLHTFYIYMLNKKK